jgi:quercetin dioxygenase-like cupin family protein
MNSKRALLLGTGLLGVCVLMMHPVQSARGAAAQNHKPVMMTHLYTGPDGQTHAEEIEAKFTPEASGNDLYKLMANSGAVLNRASPGRVADWHTAPRRQYVITLSGHGEVELVDGTKIELGPGSIDFAEDLTGKGHITRTIGNEDRVTVSIPLSAQK